MREEDYQINLSSFINGLNKTKIKDQATIEEFKKRKELENFIYRPGRNKAKDNQFERTFIFNIGGNQDA